MASLILSIASSSVSPSDKHPGRSVHSTTYLPSDRLEKGGATVDELLRELGIEDIEVHLDELVDKKLGINNGDGTYSLCSDFLVIFFGIYSDLFQIDRYIPLV